MYIIAVETQVRIFDVHQSFKGIPASYSRNKNGPKKVKILVAISGSLMRSLPCLEYAPGGQTSFIKICDFPQ